VLLAGAPDPDWPAIIADLEWSIAMFERVGARPRQARSRAELARILESAGRPDEAAAQRHRADELLSEMGLATSGANDT